MKVKASSPLGQKLYDLADRIARAKNPHLWLDNYITLPESEERRQKTPLSVMSRGLWALRMEMNLAMGASEFYELVGELDLSEFEGESDLERLANAWNEAQSLLGKMGFHDD